MESLSSPDPLELLFASAARLDGKETLLTVADVAATLKVEPGWVYDHAAELGALRLGQGPRAPIRFEARTVAARLRTLDERIGLDGARPARRPARKAPSDRPALLPIRGRLA